DEGNNWINISWGPLALMGPTGQATGAGNVDTFLGNYTPLSATSPTVNFIQNTGSNNGSGGPYRLAPDADFFGNARKANNAVDAGAVEFMVPAFAVLSVSPTSLTFNGTVVGTTSAAQTLTLTNNGGAQATTIAVVVTAPFSRSGGSCGATLNAGANCSINVVFTPTNTTTANGTVTITASVPVTGSPVSLTGTGVAAVRSASVAPSPLAFGNWATGTTSNPINVTVTNTGNVALAGGTFTFNAGSRYSRSGGSCGAGLAVCANCTIGVVFAPNATGAIAGTLTVAYTGATVTPTPVSLTGTGVA